MRHLDFWIPIAGLLLACAGLAIIFAYGTRWVYSCREKAERDIGAYKLEPISDIQARVMAAMSEVYTGVCGVCGLEHGSNAAVDGNKQACVEALLAKLPKRGDLGRFTKRS